jgi:murein DD-endopeptidase MepM/ murein hydrolase activator NlpD
MRIFAMLKNNFMQEKEKKKKNFSKKLKNKYRLIVANEESFEEKLSFRFSRLNLFVLGGSFTIILIVLTTLLIALTPLKEYIPGYSNLKQKDLYDLRIKTDSLEQSLIEKELYILNIRQVIMGSVPITDTTTPTQQQKTKKDIDWIHSAEDSMLRYEVESVDKYSLQGNDEISNSDFVFINPINGIVTNKFNPIKKHFGVDVVAKENAAIKSIMSGRVIFSSWTAKTGYTIIIQHKANILSIYKHNTKTLCKPGDYVSLGEAIAIIGNTGNLSYGQHLHFELWIDGNAVNPETYIKF